MSGGTKKGISSMSQIYRELKFRAWLVEYKKYVYILGFVYGNTDIRIWWQESSGHIYNQSFNLKHIIIEQFTTREDMNKKGIYAGDIAKTDKGTFEITYESDFCAFMCWNGFDTSKSFQLTCDSIIYHNIKVIGDIHKNQELLK